MGILATVIVTRWHCKMALEKQKFTTRVANRAIENESSLRAIHHGGAAHSALEKVVCDFWQAARQPVLL